MKTALNRRSEVVGGGSRILLSSCLVLQAVFTATALWAATNEDGGKLAPHWSRPASSNQVVAVKQAEADGIRVEWHQDLGTPRSIRGPQLDRSAAWSNPGRRAVAATEKPEERALGVLDNLARLYQMKEARKEMRVTRTEGDALGYQHVRMEQVYEGLRVVGGELLVHFNKLGQAYQVNGEYVADINTDLKPQITPAESVRLAQTHLAATGKPSGQVTTGPEAVVFALYREPQLAYQLTLSYDDAQAELGEWHYWISAKSGEVLLKYDNIQRNYDAMVTGKGLQREGGRTVNLLGIYWNGMYYLGEATNFNMVNGFDTYLPIPDLDTTATRSTSDWGDSDPFAISAAENMALTVRHFREVHGRRPGAATTTPPFFLQVRIRANAHHGDAFWSGAVIFLNEGRNYYPSSLLDYTTTLDVVAHEFTHSVVQYSANLRNFRDSGALNESFADIFAACVGFYSRPDARALYPGVSPATANWLEGEDSTLTSVAVRDLRNPHNSATVGGWTNGYYGGASAYQGSFWDYSGYGLHVNSTVQTFFFYLLTEGGSGLNDGMPYAVTGIGITNSEKVAYRALTVYCTADTDYHSVTTAWISAAADLNPDWVPSVRTAWAAVHLPDFLEVTAPQDQHVFSGSPAAFSVKAVGASSTNFQWWKDGAPLGSATNSSYSVAAAQPADVGDYWVVVNSGSGAVTSRVAQLEIHPSGSLGAWGSNLDEKGNDVGLARVPATAAGLVSVAAGGYHNVGVRADGSVITWGSNPYWRLSVPENLIATAVAAGGYHALALQTDGTVLTWGLPSQGQCSIPLTISNVVSVSAGWYSSLLLLADGTVRAWGSDANPRTFPAYQLAVPAGLSNVVAVSAGTSHWLGLTGSGKVVEWDASGHVSLRDIGAVSICAGGNQSLALTADGTVVAWDAGSSSCKPLPAGLSNVVAVAAGSSWAMALTTDGGVVAWGDDSYGQTNVPVGLTNVTAISAGSRHGLAFIGQGPPVIQQRPTSRAGVSGGHSFFYVAATGGRPLTYRWLHDGVEIPGATNAYWNQSLVGGGGSGDYSVVISNSYGVVTSSVAALTVSSSPFIELAPQDRTNFVGGTFTFQVTAGGEEPLRYQWYSGQTPIAGATGPTLVLSDVCADLTNVSVVISNQYGIATASARATVVPMAAWGLNSYGECAIPSGLTNIAAVAAGQYHSLALLSDGTVTAWGAGRFNTLRPPYWDNGQCMVPQNLRGVVAIAAGAAHSMALKADGSVVAWGDNSYGQTAVPANLSSVAAIAAGQRHCLALRSNGTVVGWGWNSYNQATNPVTLQGVAKISAGYSHSLALLSNGTVVAWGQASGAEAVPTDLSNVVSVVAGGVASLALKSDGTVTAWGTNDNGQLDVPAGLSNVVAISGYTHFMALRGDGTLVTWGGTGQDYGQVAVPSDLKDVTAIESHGYHSLALLPTAGTFAPKFGPTARVGDTIALSWAAHGGQVYQLQRKTSLSDSDWVPVVAVVSTNSVGTATDTIVAEEQRFYRLVTGQ